MAEPTVANPIIKFLINLDFLRVLGSSGKPSSRGISNSGSGIVASALGGSISLSFSIGFTGSAFTVSELSFATDETLFVLTSVSKSLGCSVVILKLSLGALKSATKVLPLLIMFSANEEFVTASSTLCPEGINASTAGFVACVGKNDDVTIAVMTPVLFIEFWIILPIFILTPKFLHITT